jgi:hypothetical protein
MTWRESIRCQFVWVFAYPAGWESEREPGGDCVRLRFHFGNHRSAEGNTVPRLSLWEWLEAYR